ncbi:MAG: SDR family oxidoreductase [Actinobacteria bacterium]|nr:SDR family oxidoreductase [Actinomycetota bacterium]MCI0543706.1 SDR family oxidoreductase [Actinomycetota bacterium]MCI0678285.1 SDR family oxidoreductase [Actinomycetota bacterium]
MDLNGAVAIVTGSSSGIGEATARLLAASGAHVVVNSATSVDAGEAVVASLPTDSVYVQADISDKEQGAGLVTTALERFGRLDVLVNNAGWTTFVPHADLDALTDEILLKTFGVNVFGTWWLTKTAMPHLRKSPVAAVVNVTSVAGLRPAGSSIAYSMSKAALNHMTLLLAKSFGPVRVNAVAPGLIDTPWTADQDGLRSFVLERAPLAMSGSPESVAEAVLALVTNPYVSGEILVVDGGLTQNL